MDIIFEGALSGTWGMKDVLQAVLDVPNVSDGVLRISCPAANIQGKIFIAEASHIVGASCTGCPPAEAYESLRTLLEINEGSFVFADVSSQIHAEIDHSLFISISRILETLPHLPQSASELFDERTLLNKIFGEESLSVTWPPARPESKQYAIDISAPDSCSGLIKPAAVTGTKQATAPIVQWNMLESLLPAPCSTHIDQPLSCQSLVHDYFATEDQQRSARMRLRALPDLSREPDWTGLMKSQPPVRWLLAALGLSLVLCFITHQFIQFGF